MPGGDGTGPIGMGPMSGRRAGFCAGRGEPGFVSSMSGRRFGVGAGRGHRNRFYATGLCGWQRPAAWGQGLQPEAMAKEQELDALRNQAENLEKTLADIRERIDGLATKK